MINNGGSDWDALVARTSLAPARIARLAGGLGVRPVIGAPANLTVIDPQRRATVDRDASASLSRNNPWHGRDLPDPVMITISAGRVTFDRL